MKRFGFVLMLVLGLGVATSCSEKQSSTEKPVEAVSVPAEKAIELKTEMQPAQKPPAEKEKAVTAEKTSAETAKPVKEPVEKKAVKQTTAAVQKAVEQAAAPIAAAEREIDAEAGAKLFKAKCVPCHGAEGKGTAMAPAFKGNGWIKGASNSEIAKVIKEGRAGAAKKYKEFAVPMPATKGVTDEEVDGLAVYIKSIN